MTPEIQLLAGLNGAGRTTLARRLADTLLAVRFSVHERMLQLYELRFDDDLYPRQAESFGATPCSAQAFR